MVSNISRQAYADMFSPTVGDKMCLADTELWIEVEDDLTAYGEEVKFGGSKAIRDGMGQGQILAVNCVDLVLTSVLIVNRQGIVRVDIGVKDERIFAIGKAGDPDIQPNVTIPISATTEVIAAGGKIVTTGGINTHIYQICLQQVEEALVSGAATMVDGGTGPAAGTHATTCTPGPRYIPRMLQIADSLSVNIGLLSKGNVSQPDALREQVAAGIVDLKIHEDRGATPTAADRALTVADEMDVQVTLHGDTFNESGSMEDTLTVIGGHAIHTFHTERTGGGHTPDIITARAHPNILSSSTNPTLPYTLDTIGEYLDVLIVCHHLDPGITEDVAFAESRIRQEIIAVEDVLHDLGTFSLTSSDSQAMGYVGEVVPHTWQATHRAKVQRGALAERTGDNDDFRMKRYIAKYIVNPALTHSIAHEVRSIEAGKLADLVVWSPAFFGVKPVIVVKGGMTAIASMGDINASTPIPQPVHYRPIFGVLGSTRHHCHLTFPSQAATDNDIAERLSPHSTIAVIKGCRTMQEADMAHNNLQPNITVDAQIYEVQVDGELIINESVDVLPMVQRYFLF